MAQYRPAGLSDEDTDSDDGFYEKPVRRYYPVQQENATKKIEVNLQDAIINGNVGEVEKIIIYELNNNINFKLDSGWTALMHACFHAQVQIVNFLLDRDADPNLHADSVTPVMAACSNSSANNETIYNIVVKLIEKGCILNIGDRYGQTPLMRAIASGLTAVVEKLLDVKVNIEMRDQQGWTALFWAVHHNQPEILELLITQGARVTEVDRSNRTPLEIAQLHDYQNIIEILNKYLKKDEETEVDRIEYLDYQIRSWHDYYPGIEKNEKPNYASEIPQFLYGMNCERLTPLIMNTGMDLRTFLLLEEKDMNKLGIDMPYEKQRLKHGLRKFHTRGWKLNSVSGLYARKVENFSVIDCLTTLGAHLQHVYILETTLQYTLREFVRVEDQIKFEPPDSPLIIRLKTAAKKMVTNINSIRREIKNMEKLLIKINRNNPQPADVIKEKTVHEIAVGYVKEAVIVCSLGLLVYHARRLFTSLLKK